jgi:hypothetical protein
MRVGVGVRNRRRVQLSPDRLDRSFGINPALAIRLFPVPARVALVTRLFHDGQGEVEEEERGYA